MSGPGHDFRVEHPQASTALGLGIAGLLGGVLLVLPLAASPLAWRLGRRAVREIDASDGRPRGTGEGARRSGAGGGRLGAAPGASQRWRWCSPRSARSACPWPEPDRLRGRSGRWQPTSVGSGESQMPNRPWTPRWIRSARARSSAVVPAPRFVRASACLPEMATPPSAYPLVNPARSMSQAALVLTRPVGLRPGRSVRRDPVRRDHRVGEERSRAPGVVVVGVEDHALAASQGEDRFADIRQRRAGTDVDSEGAGRARRTRSAGSGRPSGSWNVTSRTT